MCNVIETITEQKIREVLLKIQKDNHCSFTDAVSMLKMWLSENYEKSLNTGEFIKNSNNS